MSELQVPPLTNKKPEWIRVKGPSSNRVTAIKALLRKHDLHTVCESAACPNISECFSHGTATFMIMGNVCTRNCSFCNIDHGKPKPLDANEPKNLAATIKIMRLKYVVITSVNRDDLPDGGAGHFVDCIAEIREHCPTIEKIEILTPDFRRCQERAVAAFANIQPDVFNHNMETVPRLYRTIRAGAVYEKSLNLIKQYKAAYPNSLTKSGLMLGVGETIDEIKAVLHDLRAHNCDMLTLGQYLRPGAENAKVVRYATPEEFVELGDYATSIGFKNVASGPLVRSSYHADLQAGNLLYQAKR